MISKKQEFNKKNKKENNGERINYLWLLNACQNRYIYIFNIT